VFRYSQFLEFHEFPPLSQSSTAADSASRHHSSPRAPDFISKNQLHYTSYQIIFTMPLLHPSPFLAQQLFTFLDHHDRGGADSDLAAALYAWGGERLQRPRRRSSEPLHPIPFDLVKKLHRALAQGAPVPPPPPPPPADVYM
jgi:hypothetical protein